MTLFSGIGAAELAFGRLGWECTARSEIDPFACAVTDHYWPLTPNLGDITRVDADDLAPVSLIMAGWPCQDHSIAGKREGLNGSRSGLFWHLVRIVDKLRKRGLRWLVLENVPGLLSDDGGRAFASVVGALVGAAFDSPTTKWQNAGCAFGHHGLVEWRVLDGSTWGPPQSRRRVFLVVDFGDWERRPPILLNPESVPWHLASPEKAQWEASVMADRTVATHRTARTVTTRTHKSVDSDFTMTVVAVSQNQRGELALRDTCGAISTGGGKPGQGYPVVAVNHSHGSVMRCSDKVGSITGSHGGAPRTGKPLVARPDHIRRLTPLETARCFGFPDDLFDGITWNGRRPPADTPIYRALGNSIMVPVLEWIGRQIQHAERY